MRVTFPHPPSHRVAGRLAAVRVASGALVAIAIAGLVAGGPLQQPTVAVAAGAASSPLTVSWAGDTSAVSAFQPARSTSSVHYDDFKSLTVRISQTTGLSDQAIRVDVSNFAGTTGTNEVTNGRNFIQAMQCWGADPLAADFRETCEWGGRRAANNGIGNSVYFDNLLRIPLQDSIASDPTPLDNVFRAVDKVKVSAKPFLQDPDGAGPRGEEERYPILDFFSPSTTNEVSSARVGADGAGSFDFEAQTADQAPQLGCGTPAHLRCWLVIVPRGSVFSGPVAGGTADQCSGILNPLTFGGYSYGEKNALQGGSPVSPKCDYWDNRINIPLDFAQVGTTCQIGSTEQRVIGSQLMVGAMSSWQPALCDTLKTTFSFSTNPDAIARQQVLEGDALIGYTGFPLASGELDEESDRTLLTATTLTYAPVAVSSVVVAFIAEFDGGRVENLTLSPRLMAKLLTQSYRFNVPTSTSDDPTKNIAHLSAAARSYRYLSQDPDFQALNPNAGAFTQNPALVLPGPSGADAIRQVWRWIQSDAQAVDFLNGKADPWGMTVNPYYLPKTAANTVPQYIDATGGYVPTGAPAKVVGMTNLDGTPQSLSTTPLDIFPREDESLAPLNKTNQRSRFDSLQFAPFTDNLLTAARIAFRADPNSKTIWDSTKINLAGEAGDWVSSGAQVPGQKFTIAITDSPSATRYGLSIASVVVPNSTTAVKPTDATMAAALDALTATSLDSVTQVDPAKVSTAGYPMTMVTYAQVNLSETTAEERTRLGAMITQITTTGQISGSARGQLPAGYLPLSAALTARATTSTDAIRAFVPSTSSSSTAYAQDPYEGGAASGDGFDLSAAGGASSDPSITEGVDDLSDSRTENSMSDGLARSGLAVSLGVGLAGLLIGPLLFRGRRHL